MSYDLSLLSSTEIMRRAGACTTVIFHALLRDKRPTDASISFYEIDENDKVVFRTLVWDFTQASNLDIIDKKIIPVAKDIETEAKRRGMTAALQYFKPQILYAMEMGSVSAMDFDAINDVLYPPEVLNATILAFPVRSGPA